MCVQQCLIIELNAKLYTVLAIKIINEPHSAVHKRSGEPAHMHRLTRALVARILKTD